jgi:CheY-like chemotaxis protein
MWLFGKRKRIVKRILIVEDEPLTAFDNETMLTDFGYTVVATLDDFEEALEVIEREQVDLILSDLRLRSHESGIDIARAARERGVPTLFATGHELPAAAEVAVGCLKKPYSERQLRAAIDSVDRHLSGERVRPPRGLELFVRAED